MARLEFTAEMTARCPPERAFDYFADHRHVAAVLDGVSRWEPVGVKTQGVGARYNVEIVAVGVPLRSVLRMNRWRRPCEIGWVSESGLIKQDGGFTFKKVSRGVHIELRIAYEPPASIVGAAVARSLDWVVRQRLERALERIRVKLEAEDVADGKH
ncbi:MAG: SRPBCC family protein [Candidatus Dormibacteraceae bacterium]